jgi:hypothetical protein
MEFFLIIALLIALALLWLDRASTVAELKTLAAGVVIDIENIAAKAGKGSLKIELSAAVEKLKDKL